MNRWLLMLAFVATAANAESPPICLWHSTRLAVARLLAYRCRRPMRRHIRSGLERPARIHAEGAVVPFALVAPASSTREKNRRSHCRCFHSRRTGREGRRRTLLSVNQTASGTSISLSTKEGQPVSGERLIGYVLDTSAIDEPLMALTFALPETAQPPTMRLSIETSDDLAGWQTLISTRRSSISNMQVGD